MLRHLHPWHTSTVAPAKLRPPAWGEAACLTLRLQCHACDRIWVSGVLLRDCSGEYGYRDPPERMRLVSGPGRPLTIS
jgi:hypothetical protein